MSRTSAQRGDPSAWGRPGREIEIEKRGREGGGMKGRKERRRRENQEQANGFIHVSEDKTY